MPLDSKRQRLVGLHTDRLIAAGIADRMLHDRADLPSSVDGCQFWVESEPAWRGFPPVTFVYGAFRPLGRKIGFRAEKVRFGAIDRLPLTETQQTLVNELARDSIPVVAAV